MTLAQLRKQIAAGETGPLYLLTGDDLQARHDVALEFGALVDAGLHAFNVQSFYANEAGTAGARDQLIGALLTAARTLPMMAPRRVLIVHEAERLLSPRKGKDDDPELPAPVGRRPRAASPVDELEQYLQAPEPLTTLVFVAGDLDGNRRLVKLVRAQAAVVDCGTLASPAEASKWIGARLQKDGLGIEPRAVSLLLETTGLSLGRIRAETDKLALYAAGEPAVTARHVRELVTPESEPGEGFAMGTAIWSNNARAALREVEAQLEAGIQPVMVLGQIRAAARKLQPDARARRGIDAVFRTDLAIKSSTGEPRFLLERLVIELCGR